MGSQEDVWVSTVDFIRLRCWLNLNSLSWYSVRCSINLSFSF
jgi:hypothetical protein